MVHSSTSSKETTNGVNTEAEKCRIVNEVEMGFPVAKRGHVDQAQLTRTYNVTSNTIKRTLLSAEKVKS